MNKNLAQLYEALSTALFNADELKHPMSSDIRRIWEKVGTEVLNTHKTMENESSKDRMD